MQLIANISYIKSKKIIAATVILLAMVPNVDAQQQDDSLKLAMADSIFTLNTVVVKADKVIKKSDGMTIIPQKDS